MPTRVQTDTRMHVPMQTSMRAHTVYLTHVKHNLKYFTCERIVHPESFRSNAQNAIAFARRNRPRVKRNDEFACVYLRSRAFAFVFAFVCEYCSRSTAYVRAHARTYVYIYTQLHVL